MNRYQNKESFGWTEEAKDEDETDPDVYFKKNSYSCKQNEQK